MATTTVFPSLLVFGPQTSLPSVEVFARLRQVLIEYPRLAGLREAVQSLPEIWQKLTQLDPDLKTLPADKHLSDLQRWIEDGVFSYHLDNLPNLYVLPVTVLLQIALYVRYLHQLPYEEAQSRVLEALKSGGIQGFCIGFLTAVAIACAENEEDIATLGAISLRLAICIGAYVDREECFAQPPNKMVCIAVRYRDIDLGEVEVATVIQAYPHVSKSSLIVGFTGK